MRAFAKTPADADHRSISLAWRRPWGGRRIRILSRIAGARRILLRKRSTLAERRRRKRSKVIQRHRAAEMDRLRPIDGCGSSFRFSRERPNAWHPRLARYRNDLRFDLNSSRLIRVQDSGPLRSSVRGLQNRTIRWTALLISHSAQGLLWDDETGGVGGAPYRLEQRRINT